MRYVLLLAAIGVAVCWGEQATMAGEGCSAVAGASDDGCGDGCSDGCGCGLFGQRCRRADIEGLDRHFNCGCKGSYNYPVPPLYTYHWPGMYKQQLMTDYRSPWRFPPLKPYVDEVPLPAAIHDGHPALRPVSFESTTLGARIEAGQIEPISSRLMRSGR